MGRADAGNQLQHAKPGHAAPGILGKAQDPSMSFTWVASRNLRPPNLANGNWRRVSSSSSAALCEAARNSTAWDLSVSKVAGSGNPHHVSLHNRRTSLARR